MLPTHEFETLVVVAHPDEATAFLEANVPIYITGHGPEQAKRSLIRRLETSGIEQVLVFGTAGRVNKNLDPYQIYEINYAVRYGDGRNMSLSALHNPSSSLNVASIVTADTFVTEPLTFPGKLPDLVDMETYSYLEVAKILNLPMSIFKIVSDDADSEANFLWDSSVSDLSKKLYKHYRNLL